MNPRTKILTGVAILGAIIAVAMTFLGGGGDGAVKPLHSAGSSGSPAPAGAPVAAKSGYDAYRLIRTRNVFDPDRRPLRTASETPAPTVVPTHADFVALTGVMVNQERSLAFFSGSRAEYNKVLALRDRIAGAEITQILPASIEIDRSGQKTQVAVGQTVPFTSGALPAAAPAPETYASAPSTSSAAATGASSPGSRTGPASSKQEEIRRRLEERHRQEQQ